MTSSASGAGGRSELFGEEGRKKKKRKEEKKKKKEKKRSRHIMSHVFSGAKFVSRLRNVKCSVAIVDTDHPKSGEEPAGAGGRGRGRSVEKSDVRPEFL